MDLVIEILEKKKCPKILLNRPVEIDDLRHVDDRDNVILFLMEENIGWTYLGKVAVLKLRFSLAEEIKQELEKYLDDAVVKGYALNLWKVHRFEVKKNEATSEKEEELKRQLLKIIEASINKINIKADSNI